MQFFSLLHAGHRNKVLLVCAPLVYAIDLDLYLLAVHLFDLLACTLGPTYLLHLLYGCKYCLNN